MVDLERVRHTIEVTRAALHVASFHNDTLVAGPYTGELGVELLDWSGYVRRQSTKYRRTVVISYPGNRCLYDPCEYYPHELRLGDSGFWYGSLPGNEIGRLLHRCVDTLGLTKYDWLHPSHLNRITKRLIGPQLFMTPLTRAASDIKYDIAFHFRHLQREDHDVKNYPIESARELVEKCRAKGISLCCIGHPEYSLCPEGCTDLRVDDLSATRQALEAVRIVAGGSSGPMHFASLCGLPIIIWIDREMFPIAVEETYRGRGNPHNAPVFVASDTTFQPAPEQVYSQIVMALQSL